MLVKPHFDNNGRDLAIEHIQDIEDIIELNKQDRREEQRSDWGRHIARIPDVIYLKWFDEEHAKGNTTLRMYSKEFDEIVHKKLKDPEWAYLRVDKPALITGWLGFGS
jgi:hypothetical protein